MIRLVLPTEDYEEQILDYKASFERDGDSLDGTAGLLNFRTFKEWYEALLDNSCEATVREKALFPPRHFWLSMKTTGWSECWTSATA